MGSPAWRAVIREATSTGLRLSLADRWLSGWHAHWFEMQWRLSCERVAALPAVTAPTMIVGLWRTGTTRLHERLARLGGWTTPNTWQCFHPGSFLLQPPPTAPAVQRPMDTTWITTTSAQEDEFAALLLGEPSVYRTFVDPRDFSAAIAMLMNWRTERLSSRWEDFLRLVLSAHPGPLLLKSPNHTFRLPWLAERYPTAQFVWLHRDRAEVADSIRRMWTAMVAVHGRGDLDRSGLERFVDTALTQHDAVLAWANDHLADRVIHVSHTDAVADDAGWLADLNERLRASDPA
jgi:omega-hydroxy-beta-dihydromenaquinone-9 sulfotransferase